jgi:hypothetical protein
VTDYNKKPVTIFIGDSVPTAHLPLSRTATMSNARNDRDLEQRSAPTGHLPRAPREDGAGASVPTGHLPTDNPASPKPSDPKK